ncbi:MAG: hypothetical protein SVW51_07285 [Pseudomonadota bacterium]|nr:hypothetical protein [Pseudomonadota bacterium]
MLRRTKIPPACPLPANGIVLIDISAPEPLTEERSIKEWMVHFNDQMKQKFDVLNTQVDELEKSR